MSGFALARVSSAGSASAEEAGRTVAGIAHACAEAAPMAPPQE